MRKIIIPLTLIALMLSTIGYLISDSDKSFYLLVLGSALLFIVSLINFYYKVSQYSFTRYFDLRLYKIQVRIFNVTFLLLFLLALIQIFTLKDFNSLWKGYLYWGMFGILNLSFFRVNLLRKS